MKVIHKSVIVPFLPAQMFELVNNIEQYPEFLPWCRSTCVHSRSTKEIQASIYLMKGGMQHSFTTLNRLETDRKIEVQLLKGPFRHLEGVWSFEGLEAGTEGGMRVGSGGCRVSFYLAFELSNKLISLAFGSVLEKVAESFIDAFLERARVVYGR